jgi:hypothetical protein
LGSTSRSTPNSVENCMPFIVANDIAFWRHFGNYLAELLREQNALWFLARDSDFVMTFSCLGVKREALAEPQSKS